MVTTYLVLIVDGLPRWLYSYLEVENFDNLVKQVFDTELRDHVLEYLALKNGAHRFHNGSDQLGAVSKH